MSKIKIVTSGNLYYNLLQCEGNVFLIDFTYIIPEFEDTANLKDTLSNSKDILVKTEFGFKLIASTLSDWTHREFDLYNIRSTPYYIIQKDYEETFLDESTKGIKIQIIEKPEDFPDMLDWKFVSKNIDDYFNKATTEICAFYGKDCGYMRFNGKCMGEECSLHPSRTSHRTAGEECSLGYISDGKGGLRELTQNEMEKY